MPWAYDPGRDMFVRNDPRWAHRNRPERVRRHNLTCAEGDVAAGVMGTRHDWESWGIATTTAGLRARDAEMLVCTNCMRVKYGKTICEN